MKKKSIHALRICGWLVIAFATMELCARTEDKVRYGAPFFANYNLNSLYQFDELGRYGRPNASYLKWHLNEVGYRSPALRTGTYRIACMGSSETFGRYESPDKEWPRQLESRLNQRAGDDHYEVVNIAYPGLSVATMVRRLPQILSTLHPKLVVFYPSYTPYIAIDHPYVPQPPAPVKQVSETFEPRLSGRIGDLARTSLSGAVRRWLRLRLLNQNAVGDKAMDRLPEQNIQAFKSDLDTLTKQLLANRVQVVLVTHANRFGSNLDPVDEPLLADWRTFFPSLEEQGFLDMERRMSDAVRQVGASRSVSVVDAATLIAPGRSNFVEFVHFNDAGALALATIVADQVDRDATLSASNVNTTHQ